MICRKKLSVSYLLQICRKIFRISLNLTRITYNFHINPNQGGLFDRSIEWGGRIPPAGFWRFLSAYLMSESVKKVLKWKLASFWTHGVFENQPMLHIFVAVNRQNNHVRLWKFPSLRSQNFWKFTLFHLHRQYVYQMKAGIILNSNLAHRTWLVLKKIQKYTKWNFFEQEFLEKKNFEREFFGKKIYDPLIFFSKLIINTKNEKYVKILHS